MERFGNRWTPATRYPADLDAAAELAQLQLDFARTIGHIAGDVPLSCDRVAIPWSLSPYVLAARRVQRQLARR